MVKFVALEVNILDKKADSDFYVCAAKEKTNFFVSGETHVSPAGDRPVGEPELTVVVH